MRLARAHGLACVALVSACGVPGGYEPQVEGGDVERGRIAIEYFECTACHVIPGVSGPRSFVGPQLHQFKHNVYIAGKFPNTPDVLVTWVRNAPSLAPETAMPAMDVSEAQARDIAAYLYSLE